MHYDSSQEELRAYCRNCIESFEIWARRLIHEKMSETYGEDYIEAVNNKGENIVKSEIRNHVKSMLESEPARFHRAVDTLFVDDIIYFLCNPKWYRDLFKPALDYSFPQGMEEVREYLNRLTPVRNALSHSNPISIRQAEQVICYTHDFIDGLKVYYKKTGEDRMWNIPSIIRATDSLGNTIFPLDGTNKNFYFTIEQPFYVGDKYSIQIEVDPAFSPESYTIHWVVRGFERSEFINKTQFVITFSPKEVGETVLIECQIISNKEWHKHYGYDDELTFFTTVLPPVV